MAKNIDSRRKIVIKAALHDLGLEFAGDNLSKVVGFFDRQFRESVEPDIMIDILSGLETLHNNSAANELLDFIYDQNKVFTSYDLLMISKVLKAASGTTTISDALMTSLRNSTEKSDFISNLIVFLEKVFFRNKSHIDMFGLVSAENGKRETGNKLPNHGFEYYEMQGDRRNQEDSLVWKSISSDTLARHTNEEIGHRLWTVYQDLDAEVRESKLPGGTTASTTVCKDDALITATLSDTIAFAVIQNADGKVNVEMLADKVRSPSDRDERRRIQEAGGFVKYDRVNGSLATPRSIGDTRHTGRCPDADINIFDLTRYANAQSIHVITVCDGFTEPLVYGSSSRKIDPTKKQFEGYLESCLTSNKLLPLDTASEGNIARVLANNAYKNGSMDNISVSVQRVSQANNNKFTGMLGIYDGHGGYQASHYVANNIIAKMQEQLELTPGEYAQQANSVQNREVDYNRDNKQGSDDQPENQSSTVLLR